MDDLNPAAYVILGGFITAAATLGVAWLNVRGQRGLDSYQRKDNRRLGRDNFQRDTLLALQEAIGEVNAELIKYRLRHEGIVPDPGTAERYRVATGRVITLRSRVSDEQIRDAAAAFIKAAGEMTDARDASSSEEGLDRAAGHAARVMDRSGKLIVATFAEPSNSE